MAALEALDLPASETNIEQAMELLTALTIFDQRNTGHYDDLWKDFGWEDSLVHMRSKVSRATKLFREDSAEKDLDDAYDLMNYTAFFSRNVKDGNRHGTS